MTDTTNRINLAKKTSILSFGFGTFLLLLYYFFQNDTILFIGYVYVALITIANLIVLLRLLKPLINDSQNRIRTIFAICIMISNIPVLLLYVFFVLYLLNTLRITFVNSTNRTLSNLTIYGCTDTYTIESLNPKEENTVWIELDGDCEIDISYFNKNDSIRKIENVEGYISAFMGQKKNYYIGTKK